MCEILNHKNKVFNKINSLAHYSWYCNFINGRCLIFLPNITNCFSFSFEQPCPSDRLGLSPYVSSESDHLVTIWEKECNAVLANEREGSSEGILRKFSDFKLMRILPFLLLGIAICMWFLELQQSPWYLGAPALSGKWIYGEGGAKRWGKE